MDSDLIFVLNNIFNYQLNLLFLNVIYKSEYVGVTKSKYASSDVFVRMCSSLLTFLRTVLPVLNLLSCVLSPWDVCRMFFAAFFEMSCMLNM